jgi:2-oxoisovalerate dehydrogenase E1 component
MELISDKLVGEYQAEFKQALTIRLMEERLLQLFTQGKLFGTVHTCIGQEFAAVAIARAIDKGDYWFSNHRCHGHFVAHNDDVEGLIAEVMGKVEGVCKGFGGSQHLCRGRFFSNGIQGGIVPLGAGLALAQKLENTGGISVVCIGDGTLGEGVLYETMNLISKWELPLLVVMENNNYAQSTSQSQTLAGGIDERFAAFGIKTSSGNTWDYQELFEAMERSVDFVKSQRKPAFFRVDTYRLMAHSKGDDNRCKKEISAYLAKDPVNIVMEKFKDELWLKEALKEIKERLDTAVARADAAGFSILQDAPNEETNLPVWSKVSFPEERVVELVRRGLGKALDVDERVLVLGEDVESPYGGAFKATEDLSITHAGRVKNTPISEAAILGIANGLALGGFRPVVEIMFGDFLTLCMDQWINHSAKFAGMYANQVEVPVIIRTPMGGKRGYGPTHSQSIEKHFIGVPDTRVLCLNHRYSPEQLYEDLLAVPDLPTLVVENKMLYGKRISSIPPPGFDLVMEEGVRFPTVRLKPLGLPDITVISIGGMGPDAEMAALWLFDEKEILVDLFLPTQLFPFNFSAIYESIAATKAVVVVEEGQGFGSLSSEILAQVAEKKSFQKTACGRVTAAPQIIPSARPLEEECLPQMKSIVDKILEVLNA